MSSTRITLPNEVMLGSVKELLAEGQQVIIMTKGFSMLPFIVGKRDSVLLEKRPAVQPGEIALAEISPGHYVLHRVRQVGKGSVTLQGDGNPYGQEHCAEGHIVGTVLSIQCPGRPDVDPCSPAQMRRWHRWIALPAWFRRYYLAFYRRLKRLTI